MSKSRWDEKCPHCETKLNVHGHWVNGGDYSMNFEFECPHCEKPIDCTVEMTPNFALSKGLTPEEQKAQYQREREARLRAIEMLKDAKP